MKKFAFLVHPRGISDMYRPLPWLKYVPSGLTDSTIRRLKGRLGFIVWSKFNVFDRASGWIIFISLTGEQIMSLSRNYVQQRMLDAVLYAQNELGVSLVGLGAYTAPITDAGRWLVRQKEVKVNITHGDAYSVAVAVDGVEKLSKKLNKPLSENVLGIVGAYGLIGKCLSRIFAKKCKKLYLIGRNKVKLEMLAQTLPMGNSEIIQSLFLNDVINCDFIITATSYSKALIQPNQLKKGAVIYDIAQPINVDPSVIEKRPDIIRVDGCYAKIPGIELGIEMGPPKGATFSCLTETIMQALEGDNNNYIGDIKDEHIERTSLWAKKYGFTHADFSNFSGPLII